jgi:hypothetical protein
VQDAVAPAIETARVVLDKVKDTAPDEIEVKFGIKLTWRPSGAEEEEPDEAQ